MNIILLINIIFMKLEVACCILTEFSYIIFIFKQRFFLVASFLTLEVIY